MSNVLYQSNVNSLSAARGYLLSQMAALRRMSALRGPHQTPKELSAHFPALLTHCVVLQCEALEYSTSWVALPWLALLFRRSRSGTGGAAKAQLNPTSQSWTIFSTGLADFTSMGEELLGFVCSCVSAIFYQMGERVSRCDSADSVFLRVLVGPKFSIDEG